MIKFVVFILAVLVGATTDGAEVATQSAWGIELKIDNQNIALGESIRVTVTYRNSSAAEWNLEKPNQSGGVFVHYGMKGVSDKGNSYALGQTRIARSKLPDGSEMVAYAAPPKEPLRIKSGEAYAFTIDLSPQSDVGTEPGEWKVWITDKNVALESGKANVKVTLGKKSVPLLLAVLEDTNEMPHVSWAVAWLKKLKPDFRFRTPNSGTESEAEKAKRREENQILIDDFKVFWRDNGDSETVKALFKDINDSASATSTRP